MGQDVGVRVTEKPLVTRDLDAAEDQLPALCEAVNIVTDAGPDNLICGDSLVHGQSKYCRRTASARQRSRGRVILMFIGDPSTTDTARPSRSTSCESSVPMKPS